MNVLVEDKGEIKAILDWETCTSHLAPEWELAAELHDLSIDEKETFLEGYGLSAKQIAAAAPAVKAFHLVNYVGNANLQHHRTRLSGALDLYCLSCGAGCSGRLITRCTQFSHRLIKLNFRNLTKPDEESVIWV